jgi:NitT/TauT family transport system permease protein
VRELALRLFSVVCALAAWIALSRTLPDDLFPGPLAASTALLENIASGSVFKHLGITMLRVAGGLLIAMLIGAPLGILMGLSRLAEKTLDIWVMIALAVPSLCYGLVCFIVLGLNEWAAVVAIGLTGAPSITVNIWEGVKNIDARLLQMAQAFRASRWLVLYRVVLPQVLPYVMASLRFGLGVIWKIAVLIELLGRPDGVGFQLYYWYQLADMRQVLAWTLLFTLVMLFIELVLFKVLERRLFAWRPTVAT